ncbi:hypothetical protein MITS9509_00531 [Synechococcus sp. MIT S9509]|uniref:hypothetical protein n=1 Tax=unclassified Synechococcus TaxID=2626047 RepID=UPI0007BC7BD1|nr:MULTISPECIES: hypothetical protein [unclassified Synechococcus]KZR87731.1 hypothetical protein MITS9504_00154 [Synechococcus sp. MIT S9504]KZR93237.1 hypothetical protein MITS9509_00531 [Synechococcus sp. MIT S9509]
MVLNRKGFFLELGDHQAKAPETKAEAKQDKAESAPESSQPAAAPAPVEEVAPAPVAVAAESKTDTRAESAEVEAKEKLSLTTADAIAAELAAADSARPEVELVTFAPDALQPGNSIRPGKRRPGNNLAGFRSMATDLFKG